MAYATMTDLQGMISQFTITSTSVPTTTQATLLITDTASEIDARLAAKGVTVPVASPASFVRALALLNAYGAAAAVLKSKFPAAIGPGETPAWAFWEKRYQDGLDAISDGSMLPPDVTGSAGSDFVLPSTYLTENPDTEVDTGVIAEPMFKIGKVY